MVVRRGDYWEIVNRAIDLWGNTYEPEDIVPTVRQYFYALAVDELVEKNQSGYDKVQRVLAQAREAGDFPWDGIYDALRQIIEAGSWDTLEDYAETIKRAYRRNKWQSQPKRVEVWIEKDAVRGTVESLCKQEQVPLLVNRGYLSVTAKMNAVRRLQEDGRKRLLVIYIGDFDPSGVNMIEEAHRWINESLKAGFKLDIDRIAITQADHANPKIDRLDINKKDARSRDFMARFGDTVVEVEALPPVTLKQRLKRAIVAHRDPILWQREVQNERRDKEELARRLG